MVVSSWVAGRSSTLGFPAIALTNRSCSAIKLFDEAHQRKKMSVSYPIDVTFAREIATRAVEMMRIELAWPKTQVEQADANPDKSVKFLSLYPTKTLAKAILWKILRKSASILRIPQSL
ncbi:MAG: hypothetical protein RMI89_03205, partial [Gloeomargarita sp. SKYBB_i_bin120]|nr:hypothetical protein [Gloeomargarita sp. SKYB120]MDW8177529.1 hypothetical protein [Gloeomargarita sp. SKYBB_i_bin120]